MQAQAQTCGYGFPDPQAGELTILCFRGAKCLHASELGAMPCYARQSIRAHAGLALTCMHVLDMALPPPGLTNHPKNNPSIRSMYGAV